LPFYCSVTFRYPFDYLAYYSCEQINIIVIARIFETSTPGQIVMLPLWGRKFCAKGTFSSYVQRFGDAIAAIERAT
jgi:hypothetical protein